MFGFLPILHPFYALLLSYLLWGSHVMKTDYICIHPIPSPTLLCLMLASKPRQVSTLSHPHTPHDDNSHCLHPDSTHWSHASRPLYAPQRNLMPVTCVYESRLILFRSLCLYFAQRSTNDLTSNVSPPVSAAPHPHHHHFPKIIHPSIQFE